MMPLCLISFSVSQSCLRQYWLLGSMWRHTPGILNILDASNKLTYVDQVCLLNELGLWARTQSCHWRVWVWGALSIWDSANSAARGIPFILANAIQREAAENKLDPDLLPNLQLENSTRKFFGEKLLNQSISSINWLHRYIMIVEDAFFFYWSWIWDSCSQSTYFPLPMNCSSCLCFFSSSLADKQITRGLQQSF